MIMPSQCHRVSARTRQQMHEKEYMSYDCSESISYHGCMWSWNQIANRQSDPICAWVRKNHTLVRSWRIWCLTRSAGNQTSYVWFLSYFTKPFLSDPMPAPKCGKCCRKYIVFALLWGRQLCLLLYGAGNFVGPFMWQVYGAGNCVCLPVCPFMGQAIVFAPLWGR